MDAAKHTARAQALEELGKASAEMCLLHHLHTTNRDRIRAAIERVEQHGGQELVVESIAVCGMFHVVTRLVDATGRQPLPDATFFLVFHVLMRVATWLGGYFG
jgi:hypothetical protein